MTTRYFRCDLPVDYEMLVDGKIEIQTPCTGPSGTIPEGPHFFIAPGEVAKCSDDLASGFMVTARTDLGAPLIFGEVVPDPDPPAVVDIDVDALIAAIVGG